MAARRYRTAGCSLHPTVAVELSQAPAYCPAQGMYQFLRHQELCFPEKKPSGAELERQAAFSSMNWFETVVKPLFVFGFGFCPFEGALCSQTDSGLLATSFTDMEMMSGLAGRALGWGLRLAGAGRLLPRCLLLHWVTTLSTAMLCMDTRPGPSCSANQQHASALGALEQPTHLSLWSHCFKINTLGPWSALQQGTKAFPIPRCI